MDSPSGKPLGLFAFLSEEEQKELDKKYEERMSKMLQKSKVTTLEKKLSSGGVFNSNTILNEGTAPTTQKGEALGLLHFLSEEDIQQMEKNSKG